VSVDSADKELALEDEFAGKVVVKGEKKLLVVSNLRVPRIAVHALEFFKLLLRKTRFQMVGKEPSRS